MDLSDLLILCDFYCSIFGGHEDDDELSLHDSSRLIIYMYMYIIYILS